MVRLDDLRRDKAQLPVQRGLYGFFFARAPGAAPVEGCLQREGRHLLYIGSAGADLRRDGTLRVRLGKNHLGGNERRSTICMTLAALMPELAGAALFESRPKGVKYHTAPEGVARLCRWMDTNMAASWMAHRDPATQEAALIERYRPPLNLDFRSHPFADRLNDLRAERKRTAIAMG